MRPGRATPALAVLAVATLVAPAFADEAAPPAAAPAPAASAPAPASAEGDEATRRAKAADRFTEARALYARGEYEAAIAALEEALALDPSGKELVYNLGVVHEKLGDLDEASRWYERYLAMETDEQERDRVRGVLRRLEGARREIEARRQPTVVVVAPDREPRAPPEPTRRKGRLDAWVWSTGGLAVVAAGAGAFLGLRALAERPDAPATTAPGTSADDLDAAQARAHRLAIGADVALALAAVSTGAATWLYFGRDAEAPRRAAVRIVPTGPGGALLVAF